MGVQGCDSRMSKIQVPNNPESPEGATLLNQASDPIHDGTYARPRRRKLADYGSLMFFTILSNAALGGIALVTARAVTTNLRGQLLIGLALSGVICVVATFGINISARQGLRAKPEQLYFLGTYLTASSFLSLVGGLAAPLPLLLVLDNTASVWPDGLAISLQCGTLIMSALAVEAIHALERHKLAASLDAVGSISGLLVLVGYLANVGTPTLAGMLVSLALGNALRLLICLAALAGEPDFRTIKRGDMRRLFANSRGNHGTVVGVALLMKGDRYILGYALGPAAVSFYATASTISELIWLPAKALANYFYSGARSRAALEKATRLVVGVLVLGAVALAAFASPIIGFLFGPAYSPSVHLVWVLLPGSIAMAVYFLDSARLMGEGRGRETRRQLLWPLIILLIGTSIVARWLGLSAAAASCSVAYIILALNARHATKENDRVESLK